MVFLQEFLKKVDFEKNQRTPKKCEKLPSRQSVKKGKGGVTGYSLTGDTVLCPSARHFILYLVLVQHKKHPATQLGIFGWEVMHQLKSRVEINGIDY